MEPIGYLESCYRDKFGTPRQSGLVKSSWARLRIRSDLQPEQALEGIEGFSHLWLVWVFHQNKTARYHAKVHPPRLEGKTMGVFATRSPHRPNPIGLSLVELIAVEGDSIVVAGADIVDGTPILDIKPYLPDYESKPQARAGWLEQLDPQRIQVRWTDQAQSQLLEWQGRRPQMQLREMIEETLKLDPRPVVYRGFEGGESPYRDLHAFRLLEGDIQFKFVSANDVEVVNILFMNN